MKTYLEWIDQYWELARDLFAAYPWLLPIFFAIGGFVVAFFFDKILVPLLKKLVRRSGVTGKDIVLSALEGKARNWFIIGGFYLALLSLPLTSKVTLVAKILLLSLLILSVTNVVTRLAVGFIYLYRREMKGVIPSTTIITNLAKFICYTLGFLVLLKAMGVSITPLLTAMGVGGLAVALALQDTLSNLFSGLYIVASRQVRPGDYVELSTGEEGYITDVTWRNTTIKAIPNNRIVVPNASLASAHIVNYHLPEKEMTVKLEVGVSYDSDLQKVEDITLEVAIEVLSSLNSDLEFDPFIRYHTFGDSSINFTVYLRAKEFFDQYEVRHEFIKALHSRYKEEGIDIPFPIRTVYMHDDKEGK